MSMGPVIGVAGSAAGTSMSQTAGSETERTQRDTAALRRQADGNERTDRASGIGQTQEDQATSERDADGRRLWESQEEEKRRQDNGSDSEERDTVMSSKQSKDPTGQSGTKLDVTG